MRLSPPVLAAIALLALPVMPTAPAAASTPPRAPVASAADYADEPYADDEDAPAPYDESDPDGSPGADDPAVDQPQPVTPPIPDVPFEHGPQPPPAPLYPPLVTTGTVPGREARLRTNGRAAIPRGAPLRVRAIIAAANRIIGRPYKWGGGHARLADRGYDCSGTVSYALIRSGELGSPLVSGSFARWGSGGRGSFVTIYANRNHVYMEVAGLRLDTSPVADPTGRSGVRWRPAIGRRTGFAVRHVPGL